MRLSDVSINVVWERLGGGPLRGSRGKAFWRRGDSLSVSINPAKGSWFDFRDDLGGGVLKLVETALGCDTGAALGWLEQNCGLDPRRPLSRAERFKHVSRIHDLQNAEYFRRAVVIIAEQILEDLPFDSPERLGLTLMIQAPPEDSYQYFRLSYPKFAAGLVLAGKRDWDRRCELLARFITAGLEVRHAA